MTPAQDRAHELMESAHRLIAQGSWAKAGAALEEAAAIHMQAGRSYDQARCLQLAATLHRSAGDLAKAAMLADRAGTIPTGDAPLDVSIATERAQSAFDQGRYDESIQAFDRALDAAESAKMPPGQMSALERKRAAAQAAMGSIEQASRGFERACELLDVSGDHAGAQFVRVEEAGMLAENGRTDQAQAILDAIDASGDAHLRADILVLRSKLARAGGQ